MKPLHSSPILSWLRKVAFKVLGMPAKMDFKQIEVSYPQSRGLDVEELGKLCNLFTDYPQFHVYIMEQMRKTQQLIVHTKDRQILDKLIGNLDAYQTVLDTPKFAADEFNRAYREAIK